MPRTRPAPLPRELPDVGTVRRRARMGTGLVVALLVLPFAVGGIVWARLSRLTADEVMEQASPRAAGGPDVLSGAQRTQTSTLRLQRLSPDTASTAQRYRRRAVGSRRRY